jgi:hypothetical protein
LYPAVVARVLFRLPGLTDRVEKLPYLLLAGNLTDVINATIFVE